MPRGRKRTQKVQAPPGQTFGERGRQEEAQRQAGGLPAETGATVPSSSAFRQIMPSAVPLDAPSERPDEDVMAGVSIGPGPGPEALAPLAGGPNDIVSELRGMYAQHPNEHVRRLLEFAEREIRPGEVGFS